MKIAVSGDCEECDNHEENNNFCSYRHKFLEIKNNKIQNKMISQTM